MMNKMKSARAHLFKFLIVLPLVAVMVLSFRSRIQELQSVPPHAKTGNTIITSGDQPSNYGLVEDTVPTVRFLSLSLDDNLLVSITLDDGKKETYNLKNDQEKRAFEKKYGPLLSKDIPPTAPVVLNTAKPLRLTGSASPVKEIDRTEGDILLDIKNDMPESRVRQMATDNTGRGYDIKFTQLEYKQGKIVLCKGSIGANGRLKYFTASDFLSFIVSDVKGENGKKEFNFYISGGSLVWE